MNDCFIIDESLVLQYIIEPNKIVYFVALSKFDKIHCVTSKNGALTFHSRADALRNVDYIKAKFGIEFQIVPLD